MTNMMELYLFVNPLRLDELACSLFKVWHECGLNLVDPNSRCMILRNTLFTSPKTVEHTLFA
jgi:hypothetical protein